jgi:hypothetical protein
MPLTNSNTYIEPTAGTSLNAARLQQNDTFRSLLTNFKSAAPPVAVNLTAAGNPLGEQDGMLFRSEVTNALYISDSVHKKTSPVGGNFTRVGIGNRVENGIVALGANATSYEIGELVATVSSDGGLSANARLYLCVSNSLSGGSTVGFLDVGAPQGYSIGAQSNATFSGQSVTAISFIATANVGINTTSPTAALEVAGNVISRSASQANVSIRSGDNTNYTSIKLSASTSESKLESISAGTGANTALTIYTRAAERMRIHEDGGISIGTTTSSGNTNLLVAGSVKANTIVDTAGGNTASINGIVPILASQAEAEAGANNAVLMTALRTKQAIDALNTGSHTLLGTLTTTSGGSQTLSSLTLTSYKFLVLTVVGVSTSGGALPHAFKVGGGSIGQFTATGVTLRGIVTIDLTDGTFSSNLADTGTTDGKAAVNYAGDSTLTTASTSVTVTTDASFDAGSIRVYGVK